jgi:hypothetical protein
MTHQEQARQREANLMRVVMRQSLPMIEYRDVEYFIDFRCQQLRPVHEPHKHYPFIYLCDEELKAQIRGIRAEFSTPCYMQGLDD